MIQVHSKQYQLLCSNLSQPNSKHYNVKVGPTPQRSLWASCRKEGYSIRWWPQHATKRKIW